MTKVAPVGTAQPTRPTVAAEAISFQHQRQKVSVDTVLERIEASVLVDDRAITHHDCKQLTKAKETEQKNRDRSIP